MDRLKALPLSCPIHQMSDLHSNMDRLKDVSSADEIFADLIYIPIWID